MVLVELSSPLTLRQNVAAICLPDKDIEPRQLCVTAGWGINKPGGKWIKVKEKTVLLKRVIFQLHKQLLHIAH